MEGRHAESAVHQVSPQPGTDCDSNRPELPCDKRGWSGFGSRGRRGCWVVLGVVLLLVVGEDHRMRLTH